MKIIDIVLKLLQIIALVSVIITCSIANWWMENDHIYQKFQYDREWQEIDTINALHNAKLKREAAEDARVKP